MEAARTQVLDHRSGGGQGERVLREPDPRLGAHVRGYQGFTESRAGVLRRREVPSGDVVLIVNFGPALRLIDPREPTAPAVYRNAFVAGLHESYVLTESTGRSDGMQVNFTPIGAHLFLGLPMDALANRAVEFDDLPGTMARRLAAELRDAPTWEIRFAALDSIIAARLAEAPAPWAGVAWAWHNLNKAGGCLSIGSMSAQLGCSRKHLIAQFRKQIGLPPKRLARILRFSRVIRLLERDDRMCWAEIAHACGYYDQAHFIKDFREFAGSTPREFVPRRRPDGGRVVGY